MSWRWFGPNSISVTRQFDLMASDLLVVTDFLAWRLAREQVADINPPRGSDELHQLLFQCLRLVSIAYMLQLAMNAGSI